jgi:hypothetical protein
MEKIKFLPIISLGLLIINMIKVAFVFLRKPMPTFRHEVIRDVIIHRLKLDEARIKVYDSLIRSRQSDINNKEKQLLILKNNLFEMFKSDGNYVKKDSIINGIGIKQKAIENIRFNHFEKLELLCIPDQITDFETFMSDVASMFNPKNLSVWSLK